MTLLGSVVQSCKPVQVHIGNVATAVGNAKVQAGDVASVCCQVHDRRADPTSSCFIGTGRDTALHYRDESISSCNMQRCEAVAVVHQDVGRGQSQTEQSS